MDYFYKPPLQRTDECTKLEENYVNCLMQKALNDKVAGNKCVLNSVSRRGTPIDMGFISLWL